MKKVNGQWVKLDGQRAGCSCGGSHNHPCDHIELARASMTATSRAVVKASRAARQAQRAVEHGSWLIEKVNRARGHQNVGSNVETVLAPSGRVTVVEVA